MKFDFHKENVQIVSHINDLFLVLYHSITLSNHVSIRANIYCITHLI